MFMCQCHATPSPGPRSSRCCLTLLPNMLYGQPWPTPPLPSSARARKALACRSPRSAADRMIRHCAAPRPPYPQLVIKDWWCLSCTALFLSGRSHRPGTHALQPLTLPNTLLHSVSYCRQCSQLPRGAAQQAFQNGVHLVPW